MVERTPSPSLSRNTVLALAIQLTGAAFTAGLTLFLTRALEPKGFGVFSIALSIGALLSVPGDFGVTQSAARFLAEHRGDRTAGAGVVGDALKLKLVGTTLVSGALFALASPIAHAYGNPALAWPVRAIAVATFAQSTMLFFSGMFVALGRLSANLQVVLAESAIETGASVALVLLGGGAAGAAWGRAVGYLCAAGLAFALILRLLGRGVVASRVDRARSRAIAAYAGALAIVDGAFTLFAQIDTLIIAAYLTSTDVGLFRAPLRLAVLLQYPGLAAASAVAPRLARGGAAHDVATFVRALRVLIVWQALVAAPLLVWAAPTIRILLGSSYAGSASVLRAFVPYIVLAGLAPLLSLGVNYLGRARSRVPIAIGTVLVNLVFDLVFVPRIGIVAGAIGTDIAYLVYVPAHLVICTRLLNLDLRPLLVTTARSCAGAAAFSAVLLAFGTSHVSAATWLAGCTLGTFAFFAVLGLTGELAALRRRT